MVGFGFNTILLHVHDVDATKEVSLEMKLKALYSKVRVAKEGDILYNMCEIFHNLPSKQLLPDYYKVIKKPMDMNRIQLKIEVGT